jgi:5-methylcytosine-specific restriction endonuclease McrA
MANDARKKCTKCGEEFPATREFFGQFKNKRDGVARIDFRNVCRPCMAAHTRAYDARNPENVAARISRRQSRVQTSAPSDLVKLRVILGDLCRYCSSPLNGGGHVDHLTPVARGGTNSWSNLTLCCEACNLAKTSKTLEEFVHWRKERHLRTREILIAGERPDPITRAQLRERFPQARKLSH